MTKVRWNGTSWVEFNGLAWIEFSGRGMSRVQWTWCDELGPTDVMRLNKEGMMDEMIWLDAYIGTNPGRRDVAWAALTWRAGMKNKAGPLNLYDFYMSSKGPRDQIINSPDPSHSVYRNRPILSSLSSLFNPACKFVGQTCKLFEWTWLIMQASIEL